MNSITFKTKYADENLGFPSVDGSPIGWYLSARQPQGADKPWSPETSYSSTEKLTPYQSSFWNSSSRHENFWALVSSISIKTVERSLAPYCHAKRITRWEDMLPSKHSWDTFKTERVSVCLRKMCTEGEHFGVIDWFVLVFPQYFPQHMCEAGDALSQTKKDRCFAHSEKGVEGRKEAVRFLDLDQTVAIQRRNSDRIRSRKLGKRNWRRAQLKTTSEIV